jgi:hypothetical protein
VSLSSWWRGVRVRRRLAPARRAVVRWRRDTRVRRRLLLGFYAVLLFAVIVAVLVLVITVISARSPGLSDRLAETGDWLAGATLALAAVAGLVALQAYASATGLPDLQLSLIIEGPLIPDADPDEEVPASPVRLTGPFTFHIAIKNLSGYSARNPAVVMRLSPNYLATQARTIADGWTIIDGDRNFIFAVQWDGGPVYSIHGHSIRKLRLDVGFVMLQTLERRINFELLAEGYRRQVQAELGVSILPARWI